MKILYTGGARSGKSARAQRVAVEIVNYEVVVEVLDAEFPSRFGVILEPGQTAMTLPDEFVALGESFKYEVLAREASFNQTGIESCFTLE